MLHYGRSATDPQRERLVRETIEWLDQFGAPIVFAIAAGDGLASEWRMKDAALALHDSAMSEDQKRCLTLRLRYYRWQMEHDFAPLELQQRLAANQSILASLSVPQPTLLAESYRNALLLQVLVHNEAEDGAPVAEAVMARHFNSVLPEHMNAEFWYYVSTWAFRHGQRRCLDWALEVATLESDEFVGDYLWQRLNLMILLLEGRAGRFDLMELISRLRSLRQWRAVSQLIWPRCIEAGLVDAEVEALLAERLSELRAARPDSQVRELARHEPEA